MSEANRNAMPITEVPELLVPYSASVRLALDDIPPLPREVAALIDHPLFQRLRGVRQLGLVDRVYPSATHSRFEHSLGVYCNAINYARTLWVDSVSAYFRSEMGPRELRALFIAALCHDLGQYPFSHVLEDTERDGDGHLPSTSLFDHEYYTRELLCNPEFRTSVLADCASGAPDLGSVIDSAGASVQDVLSVLSGEDFAELRPGTSEVLHSIIDGPIDADKFDYLRRDAHHAGVGFGAAIDEHRFFQSLTVIREPPPPNESDGSGIIIDASEPPNHRTLAITSKGRAPAEQVLMARWHMFSEVYWHRTTRAHEAVLAAAVGRLRKFSEGFDAWFRGVVLHPTSSDDALLLAIRRTAVGQNPDVATRADTAREREVVASCCAMLDSISCTAGRAPYKRLVAVSASDDADLYGNLQALRMHGGFRGMEVMDALAEEVSRRIASMFQVNVHPLDLVFDVPAKRAPANTVYLLGMASPQRGRAVRLADRSTMWRYFGDAFHELTRKIRIFCPATIRQSIRDKGHDESVQLKLYDVLRQSVLEVGRKAYQLDLFPGSGPSAIGR